MKLTLFLIIVVFSIGTKQARSVEHIRRENPQQIEPLRGGIECKNLYNREADKLVRPDDEEQRDLTKVLKSFWATNDNNVFLFRYLEREIGDIPPYTTTVKDCVSHAAAMAVDVLAATQIHMNGRPEVFVKRASPEAIHWGARELGKRGEAPGVKVAYAVEYLHRHGVLYQQLYESSGRSIDLTGYDSDRANLYAAKGVPAWLKTIAERHPVHHIRHMKNGQDVVTEIKAGRPVLIGSSFAFPKKRDKDGFTTPYLATTVYGPFGREWFRLARRTTQHCMVATGYIGGDRPGIVIQDSKGNEQHGPNPLDLPDGAFAVEVRYIDKMVKDWFDSWSIGDLQQQPAQNAQTKPKAWIIMLTTDKCKYCKEQIKEFTDSRRAAYRIATIKAPKRLMERWGYKFYPTTVIVENGRRLKTFSGLTRWRQIKPHARKAKR